MILNLKYWQFAKLFSAKARKPRLARSRCFQPSMEPLEFRFLMSGNALTGPSTASTPYVQATVQGIDVISVLTTDNTAGLARTLG